jgi:SAM-dependent methyltransferase
MPSWDELFARGELVAAYPERAVQDFVSIMEGKFEERPLRVWDLCCGAGRHTAAMAARGHEVFASDASESGIGLTRERLSRSGLAAETAVADMTVCPWRDVGFHGVVAWDSLHHNRLTGIRAALGAAFEHLVPRGWLLATLKSTRADSYGLGEEIEPDTFVQAAGPEAGVPHHYFDEEEVRETFRQWDLVSLVERVCDYRERPSDHRENPFGYTVWGVLARKP